MYHSYIIVVFITHWCHVYYTILLQCLNNVYKIDFTVSKLAMTIPKTWVGSGLPSLPLSYSHEVCSIKSLYNDNNLLYSINWAEKLSVCLHFCCHTANSASSQHGSTQDLVCGTSTRMFIYLCVLCCFDNLEVSVAIKIRLVQNGSYVLWH